MGKCFVYLQPLKGKRGFIERLLRKGVGYILLVFNHLKIKIKKSKYFLFETKKFLPLQPLYEKAKMLTAKRNEEVELRFC